MARLSLASERKLLWYLAGLALLWRGVSAWLINPPADLSRDHPYLANLSTASPDLAWMLLPHGPSPLYDIWVRVVFATHGEHPWVLLMWQLVLAAVAVHRVHRWAKASLGEHKLALGVCFVWVLWPFQAGLWWEIGPLLFYGVGMLIQHYQWLQWRRTAHAMWALRVAAMDGILVLLCVWHVWLMPVMWVVMVVAHWRRPFTWTHGRAAAIVYLIGVGIMGVGLHEEGVLALILEYWRLQWFEVTRLIAKAGVGGWANAIALTVLALSMWLKTPWHGRRYEQLIGLLPAVGVAWLGLLPVYPSALCSLAWLWLMPMIVSAGLQWRRRGQRGVDTLATTAG